jgi:hypothetical protein
MSRHQVTVASLQPWMLPSPSNSLYNASKIAVAVLALNPLMFTLGLLMQVGEWQQYQCAWCYCPPAGTTGS